MKAYFSFFKMRFFVGIQYRVAAIAGIITQLAFGFMYIMMYKSFYNSNPSVAPMEFSQLSTYIWLQQSFLILLVVWVLDEEIFDEISSGNVAYEITRPLDIYNMWFVKNMANRVTKTMFRLFPIIIIAMLLPKGYKFNYTNSLASFLLFLLSITIGLILVISYTMLIYIATFFTVSSVGIRIIMVMTADFLAGGFIPIPMLPEYIVKFINLTPFASIQNTPFRIYINDLSNNEAIKYILLQIFWTALFIFIGRIIMKKALKKVVVQGG